MAIIPDLKFNIPSELKSSRRSSLNYTILYMSEVETLYFFEILFKSTK